jgi:hypothetical protein
MQAVVVEQDLFLHKAQVVLAVVEQGLTLAQE